MYAIKAEHFSNINANKEKVNKYANEFEEVFGIRLRDYFDPVKGLKIPELSRMLICSEKMSFKQFIHCKYGDRGSNLIKKLTK